MINLDFKYDEVFGAHYASAFNYNYCIYEYIKRISEKGDKIITLDIKNYRGIYINIGEYKSFEEAVQAAENDLKEKIEDECKRLNLSICKLEADKCMT